MKVQIVYLNPEDDIHSTRDKVSWVKAPRALLVWPDRGKVLSNQLDLVLLQRFSLQRKVEIGLLTFDSDICTRARELGIPVFDSMDDLPEAYWNIPQVKESYYTEEASFERRKPADTEVREQSSRRWLEGLSKRKKVLLFGMLSILSLLFLLLLTPSAIISISPLSSTMMMEIEIIPANSDLSADGTLMLPLTIENIRVMGSLTEETSGVSHVPLDRAKGTVLFTNLSSQPVEIPVNTIVRTSAEGGVRFKTTKPARLPNENGAEIEVSIEALIAGQVGNVSRNSVMYIEGPLGLILSVTNPEGLKNGSDVIRRMVTQADLELIEEKLMDALIHQAKLALRESISSDQILVDGSIESGKIYERNFSHLEGEISDTVTLELTTEFMASSLSKNDLESPAFEAVTNKLFQGNKIVTDSIFIESAEISTQDGSKEQRVLISVEFEKYNGFDSEKIKGVIRGQRPSAAISLLFKHLSLAFIPEIEIKPDWFPFLPFFRERIELRWDAE